jgi:hypothetical protein
MPEAVQLGAGWRCCPGSEQQATPRQLVDAGVGEPTRASAQIIRRIKRPLAAFASEAGEDVATVAVKGFDELVALASQAASRGDLGGLVGMEVAADRDVTGADRMGGDHGGKLEQEQRPEGRFDVEVRRRGQKDSPTFGHHT